MDQVAPSIVSIFSPDIQAVHVRDSLRDMTKLAGVMGELAQKQYFENPTYVLQVLRVIQLLNEEALGLTSRIEDADGLFYRYRNQYGEDPAIDVPHLVNILDRYGWIVKERNRITMLDVGKRMMNALIRLANDALAYHMRDEVTRSLFQARRDAEISEAYDDQGISGGNTLVSMIRNIEEAVDKLRERELEYLADRHALTHVTLIHELMKELEVRLQERIEKFQTFEESLALAPIMKRGTAVMLRGIQICIGTIGKILKFSHIQQTEVSTDISHELFKKFMRESFDKPLDSDLPNCHEILSLMERDEEKGECLDGLWVPVKFASPLSGAQITRAIHYMENYEPVLDPLDEEEDVVFEEVEEMTEEEMKQLADEQAWQLTKTQIRTDHVEEYLENVEECSIEEVMIGAGSEKWSDGVNVLLALSALVDAKKVDLFNRTEPLKQEELIRKEWEWIDERDRQTYVRRSGGKS